MNRTIDDLPMVKVSFLRAHGSSGQKRRRRSFVSTTSGVEYQVGVTAKPLPCGALVAVDLPAVRGGAQRLRCSTTGLPRHVRQGERVDLSLAVGAHREAPYGHSASSARQAQ